MYLASVSNDLKIHDCETWKKRFSYGKHDNLVEHINWSDDGKYLLQVNPSGRVEILSTTEDGVRCLQCPPEEQASTAAFHRGGHRQIALGCRNGKLYIWDTKFKTVLKSFSSASSQVRMLDFNSKNKYLAAGLDNGDTLIYNVLTNSQVGVVKVPFSNKVSSLRFHSQLRSVLALASDEGCVLLRDIDNGKNRMFIKDAHKSIVSGIEFSHVNIDVLVSCGYDKMLYVYDTRMQLMVSSIQTECALTCVDVSSESMVALGNKKGQVLIYDLREFRKPVNILADHAGQVNKVAFQPEVAKRKRLLALDASLKEPFSPKTPQRLNCKTPDSARSYDFIEQCSASPAEVLSQREKTDDNVSKDSFLVNIVGGVNDSDFKRNSNLFKDSADSATKRLKDFSAKKSQSLADRISGTSASTPIVGKIISTDDATPSPILKAMNLIHEFEVENESNDLKCNSPVKKGDSVESVSVVETVKCAASNMTELGNDLKDFITFSLYDVLEQSRNNFLQLTIQQTKNRLFLEDQISLLAEKVQDLQQTHQTLVEENKRLSVEVEMLRSTRY